MEGKVEFMKSDITKRGRLLCGNPFPTPALRLAAAPSVNVRVNPVERQA
jgi:hypothetical protein